MAAGYNGTFEIGRTYRNEGTSPEHLQGLLIAILYTIFRLSRWNENSKRTL